MVNAKPTTIYQVKNIPGLTVEFIEPTASEMACLMYNTLKKRFQLPFVGKIVDAREFVHVYKTFYKKTQRELRTYGFTYLADLNAPVMGKDFYPTFTRVLRNRNRTEFFDISHIRPTYVRRKRALNLMYNLYAMVATSYFTNGTRIAVSNGEELVPLQLDSFGIVSNLQKNVSPSEIIEKLRDLTRQYLDARPTIQLSRLPTLESVLDADFRLETRRCEAMRQKGYVTRETCYFYMRNKEPSLAAEVWEEIQNLQRHDPDLADVIAQLQDTNPTRQTEDI